MWTIDHLHHWQPNPVVIMAHAHFDLELPQVVHDHHMFSPGYANESTATALVMPNTDSSANGY